MGLDCDFLWAYQAEEAGQAQQAAAQQQQSHCSNCGSALSGCNLCKLMRAPSPWSLHVCRTADTRRREPPTCSVPDSLRKSCSWLSRTPSSPRLPSNAHPAAALLVGTASPGWPAALGTGPTEVTLPDSLARPLTRSRSGWPDCKQAGRRVGGQLKHHDWRPSLETGWQAVAAEQAWHGSPSEKGAALWKHVPPRTCCICRSACSSEASGTTSTPRSAMSASHPVGLGRASSIACACSQSVHGGSKGQTGRAAHSSLSSATCLLQCCKSIAPRVSCPACWASGPGHLTVASQECSIPQCMQLCWPSHK